MLHRVVLTRATRRNIPEDAILHSHRLLHTAYMAWMCAGRDWPHERILIPEALRTWFGPVDNVQHVVSLNPIGHRAQQEEQRLSLHIRNIISFICLWSWSGTKSTITAAIYWPIASPLLHRWWDCVAIVGMNEWQGKLEYTEETWPIDAVSTTDPTWLYRGSN
jgi:hypothetical protein